MNTDILHHSPHNSQATGFRGEDIKLIHAPSRLERINRELQRKLQQVGCFSSPKGAEVVVYIQVTRLNAQWAQTSWWEASHSRT